jgi:hypothetical protein
MAVAILTTVFVKNLLNVRFGSKADIPQRNRHVCFTPKSGQGLARSAKNVIFSTVRSP